MFAHYWVQRIERTRDIMTMRYKFRPTIYLVTNFTATHAYSCGAIHLQLATEWQRLASAMQLTCPSVARLSLQRTAPHLAAHDTHRA